MKARASPRGEINWNNNTHIEFFMLKGNIIWNLKRIS